MIQNLKFCRGELMEKLNEAIKNYIDSDELFALLQMDNGEQGKLIILKIKY